ncbi:hypothetical protein ABIA33_006161 [Streptacidiphilus sp. MAP12-16]|uniref:hypothetical protein n=1 Tax=Streptacidiphilus sp. MAP12-16 TaxID=3156300 RepID=UPI003519868F
MGSPYTQVRDQGLARTASWTRRTAAAGVLLCAALAAVFAHSLPGQSASGSGSTSGLRSAPTQGNPQQPVQAPTQPPAAGSGPGQVVSGAS